MYILRLRRVENPDDILGIARSDSPEKLLDLLRSEITVPRMLVVDNVPLIYMFRAEGPLADYMPPNPGDENVGVVNLGTLEEKIKLVVSASVAQIEQKVRDEWQNVIDNTIEV